MEGWDNLCTISQGITLKDQGRNLTICLEVEDNYIITGATDRVIRVYDIKRKQFLFELTGHECRIWALKYDANGIFVSVSTDMSVRVWDVDRHCCTHVFKGHTSTICCLDIVEYRRTKYIVTGSADHTLRVWKLPQKSPVAVGNQNYPKVYNNALKLNPYFVGTLRGHADAITTIAGHANIVISGSYDHNLMVWDIARMSCIGVLSGHSNRISSVVYDSKRSRCISASMDTTIKVWDLQSIWDSDVSRPYMKAHRPLITLQNHNAPVCLLRLSDNILASGGVDGSIICWNCNDYCPVLGLGDLGTTPTFDISDNFLVVGFEDQLDIWNGRSGHPNILSYSGNGEDVHEVWLVRLKGSVVVAAVDKHFRSRLEIFDVDVDDPYAFMRNNIKTD